MQTTNVTGSDLFINLEDIRINYDDSGTGTIPLIFIHGFPFDKSMWQPQLQILSKSNRVITYDIRGYGKSESGTKKPSISQFADDLIEFMDVMEIDKAIICGLSMGGYITMNAISRYPDRFKAMILCDTQCIADSPEVKESRKTSISKIRAGGIADFTEGFVGKIFCKATLENKVELVEQIRNTILATSTETIIGTLGALAEREEMCSKLGGMAVPTLILCGEEDKVTPLEQSTQLHKDIPGSVIHIIGGAGHLSNLEQPSEFNNHISQFIGHLLE